MDKWVEQFKHQHQGARRTNPPQLFLGPRSRSSSPLTARARAAGRLPTSKDTDVLAQTGAAAQAFAGAGADDTASPGSAKHHGISRLMHTHDKTPVPRPHWAAAARSREGSPGANTPVGGGALRRLPPPPSLPY